MRRALLVAVLASALACTRQVEVSRANWPVVPPGERIFVRTHAGAEYELTGFRFMTDGLVAWRGEQVAPVRARLTDTTRLALDDLAVVRLRQFDPVKTGLIASGVVLGGIILIAETAGDDRPTPVDRPVESCPFVYSFDGTKYVFDSETYAGAIARGLERTDVDNLDHLRAVDGRYRLLLTDERPETQYTDAVSLVVARHPVATRAVPDGEGTVHIVGPGRVPVSMRQTGPDTLPARAGWEATFARPQGVDSVALVVTARNTDLAPFALRHILTLMGREVYTWYASLAADPSRRRDVRAWMSAEGALEILLSGSGDWRSVARLPDVGPMIAKTQIVVLDLSAHRENTVTFRLESSPGLWHEPAVEIAPYLGTAPIETLMLAKAVTARGRDVRDLLRVADGRYHVALLGDTVALEFDAPQPRPGERVTTLIRTTGHYYLDADDRGTPRPDLIRRIMADRSFAQKYFDERWREATGRGLR